jgi:hypothetical protein
MVTSNDIYFKTKFHIFQWFVTIVFVLMVIRFLVSEIQFLFFR